MKNLLLILFLFSSTINFGQNTETTKVFLIRHAETVKDDTKDPELSEEGVARANKWASVLKSESIAMVYSSNYKRTHATAKAIADSKNISKIQLYDPGNIDTGNFLKEIKGKTVVVVGHSNTTPSFVNKLIGEQRFRQIDHSNHTNLYIVNYNIKNLTTVSLLHID